MNMKMVEDALKCMDAERMGSFSLLSVMRCDSSLMRNHWLEG